MTMEVCQSEKYLYKVKSEMIRTEEGGEYLSYGISVSLGDTEIITVSDVTTDSSALEGLAELCNEEELDVIHLEDVIQDFLAR